MSTQSQDIRSEVLQILQCFQLSEDKLKDISDALEKEFVRGLGKDTQEAASVKMLPTFIVDTPDGTEKGDFLALDVGGTNLRVHHVHVDKELTTESEEEKIPEEKMTGRGDDLFDFIVDKISAFIDSQKLKDQVLPLGFTFSFPCQQKAIDKSILIRWTKGFSCSGVDGKDVVQLLKEAVDRKQGFKMGPVSVVNDTAATLMSCIYRNKKCDIGLIVGTGTNACFMEDMRNVQCVDCEDGQMCINTEWGAFGEEGSLKDVQTDFDIEVDKKSNNPGVHIFEKMISGLYLGEIVRVVLVKLTEDELLFGGQISDKFRPSVLRVLKTPSQFKTEFISEIEEQDKGPENTVEILNKLGLDFSRDLGRDWVEENVKIIRWVCKTISTRAAHLCAAAVTTIAMRIYANRIYANRGEKSTADRNITVGVDGTVYKKHPNFKKELEAMVQQLAPELHITFQDSEDGSGTGAALTAAVVQRLQNKKAEHDKREERGNGGSTSL
ncbi:hypothetical protein Q5P01_019036 [Channa striata]|uniref:Phosphotransferase n=1 Tax=Channa striata TaxID=64152 RepID=A0AA88M1W3_CHASR|nr:hypothetical protein Q5P01_019036 [Channa striata]